MDYQPYWESRATLNHFMLQKPEMKAGPMGLLARMQTLYGLTLSCILWKNNLYFQVIVLSKVVFFAFTFISNHHHEI